MKPATHKRTTPTVFSRSKELRRNMTPEERKLWSVLHSHRQDRLGFRRQHAIGNYIADFCCPRKMLIIELDGGQGAVGRLHGHAKTHPQNEYQGGYRPGLPAGRPAPSDALTQPARRQAPPFAPQKQDACGQLCSGAEPL